MNRLVIIGNGFDLAHGLKTGYEDFILDYLENAFRKWNSTGEYNDKAFEIQSKPAANTVFTNDDICKIFKALRDKKDNLRTFFNNEVEKQKIKDLDVDKSFIFKFKSDFLKEMFKAHCEKWVDIEKLFYDNLVKFLKKGSIDAKSKIDVFNTEFEFIINKFKVYLSEKVIPKINAGIVQNKITSRWWQKRNEHKDEFLYDELKHIYILNFNYTSTIGFYIDYLTNNTSFNDLGISIKENAIHGCAKISSEPIIFGYGDETDSKYKILENLNDNQFLKYMKSFGYSQDNRYKELARFLDSDKYEVQIMGHSCGLSDRVMLKMIFEHKNCESIEIFYHKKEDGTNNYIDLIQNISRHFDDKNAMRLKIVSYQDSVSLM